MGASDNYIDGNVAHGGDRRWSAQFLAGDVRSYGNTGHYRRASRANSGKWSLAAIDSCTFVSSRLMELPLRF